MYVYVGKVTFYFMNRCVIKSENSHWTRKKKKTYNLTGIPKDNESIHNIHTNILLYDKKDITLRLGM
jgi:hypothetical protein